MVKHLKLQKSFVITVKQKELVGANENVLARIRNKWSKFNDLLLLLTSRGLPIGAKYE